MRALWVANTLCISSRTESIDPQEGSKKGADVTPASQTMHEAWLSADKGKQEKYIARATEI